MGLRRSVLNRWLALIRGTSATDNFFASKSTDGGATWATPAMVAPIAAGFRNDGWQTLRLARDGRVLLFIRSIGTGPGMRAFQKVDPTLGAEVGWTTPGKNLSVGNPLDLEAFGKYDPIPSPSTACWSTPRSRLTSKLWAPRATRRTTTTP